MRLTDLAEKLAWDIQVASDYGDEIGRRSPRELFDEAAGTSATARGRGGGIRRAEADGERVQS